MRRSALPSNADDEIGVTEPARPGEVGYQHRNTSLRRPPTLGHDSRSR
jgi:hypothetical protein